jgi:hypothetical protein
MNNIEMKRTPSKCPSCDSELAVTRLTCLNCRTEVAGHYRLPALLRLASEDQRFVKAFIVASGSLKAMASQLDVSYPTVRNRLNRIIDQLTDTDD